MTLSLVFGIFASSLLGSLGHCLGMCGPLVVILNAGLRRNARPLLPYNLLYHSARILVYTLLGALVGSLGALFASGSRFAAVSSTISLIAGLVVVLLGLGYLGWLPLSGAEAAAGLPFGRFISTGMTASLRRGGPGGVAALGLLNGLLPCGLVYSALLAAAASGGTGNGALTMFVFGLGTVPAVLAVGLGGAFLSARSRQLFSRAAGLMIIVVGLQLVLRAAAGYGWIAHAHLGRLMLW